MQKLYWLFCRNNFTFLQNYNIGQLLTAGRDYQVPKKSLTVIEVLLHPPDPIDGVKGQILKFCNNSKSSICY